MASRLTSNSLHTGDFRLVESHSNVPYAALACFKSKLSEKRGSEKFTGSTTSSLIELNSRPGGTVPWYYEALEEGSNESPKDLYVHHQIVCPATAPWTHDGTENAFCKEFLNQCRTHVNTGEAFEYKRRAMVATYIERNKSTKCTK